MYNTVAQIKLMSGGMSYAIQLSDGKFILVDGGTSFDMDGARLYKYLFDRSGGEKPIIAAWLFTHGHIDHIALASKFMTEYKDCIRIERILYNIPTGEDFNGYDAGSDDGIYENEWFEAVKLYPDAFVHEVHTGEVYNISGATVDVVTSAFDRYPDPPTNRNDTSAVYKITFENGVSFMLLGDAFGDRLSRLIDESSPIYRTEEQLKSDIMQVAHHGLAVVSSESQYEAVYELYRRIAPSVCFWPTFATRFYNDTWCQSEKYIYNRFLLDSVKERNFHSSQTVEINTDDMTVSLVEL